MRFPPTRAGVGIGLPAMPDRSAEISRRGFALGSLQAAAAPGGLAAAAIRAAARNPDKDRLPGAARMSVLLRSAGLSGDSKREIINAWSAAYLKGLIAASRDLPFR